MSSLERAVNFHLPDNPGAELEFVPLDSILINAAGEILPKTVRTATAHATTGVGSITLPVPDATGRRVFRYLVMLPDEEQGVFDLGYGAGEAELGELLAVEMETSLTPSVLASLIARYAPSLAAHTGLTTTAHGGIVASTDARLTDARTPTAHRATHATGGSDALTPGDIGAESALGNPGTNGFVLSSTTLGARSWIAPAGTDATKLPLAGGTMTGAIVYSGAGKLIDFTPAADTNNTFMEYAPFVTPTLKWRWNISAGISFPGDLVRPDVTYNWGYNQGIQGGRANAADAAWFLQLENHYFPSGNTVAQFEYHLNIVDTGGGQVRPFQINALKDGSHIAQSYLGDTFLWTNRALAPLFGFTTGDKMTAHMALDVNGALKAYGSFALQGAGGTAPALNISASGTYIDFTTNPTTTDVRFYNLRNMTFTVTDFTLNATNNYIYGDSYFIRNLASANTAERMFSIWRTTSGTAAAGIGATFDFRVQTSGGSSTNAARVRGSWAVAASGSQVGEIALEAYDYNNASVPRTGIVVRASAAGEPLIAFYQGVTPVARQVLATGAGATADNIITALQALGLVKQS